MRVTLGEDVENPLRWMTLGTKLALVAIDRRGDFRALVGLRDDVVGRAALGRIVGAKALAGTAELSGGLCASVWVKRPGSAVGLLRPAEDIRHRVERDDHAVLLGLGSRTDPHPSFWTLLPEPAVVEISAGLIFTADRAEGGRHAGAATCPTGPIRWTDDAQDADLAWLMRG